MCITQNKQEVASVELRASFIGNFYFCAFRNRLDLRLEHCE